jgi:hypothetical protein
MKKILSISAFFLLISSKVAHAVCPVCTIAVGAGLGLAEWLGIDDSISGLWIGALIVSMSLWTINWLNKKSLALGNDGSSTPIRKKPSFGGIISDIIIFIAYYLIVVGPLFWKGIIGHPFNKLCGIDKLLFGIILGSALFAAGAIFHVYIRKRNENKSYFKGQKIIFAIIPLIVASIILYFTC